MNHWGTPELADNFPEDHNESPPFIPRWAHHSIIGKLRHFKVVGVVGPRQSGKSTLCKIIALEKGFPYVSMDSDKEARAARQDPQKYLSELGFFGVIDEIQHVPELILAIKALVDQKPTRGRYIITGSVDLLAHKNLPDSLAGRLSYVRLYPFSQGELNRTPPVDLLALHHQLVSSKFLSTDATHAPSSALSLDEASQLMMAGGYPDAIFKSSLQERAEWFDSYLDHLIRRDLSSVLRPPVSTNKDVFLKVILNLAHRGVLYSDVSQLSQELPINAHELGGLIEALHSLFILSKLPAWGVNPLKSINKRPKIYFLDTGILCILAKISKKSMIDYRNKINGLLFESYIFSQILKITNSLPRRMHLQNFRKTKRMKWTLYWWMNIMKKY